MSLPPPVVPPSGGPPPAASTPPGWYTDPWDPRGRRWWDGSAWSGYTEDWYARSTPGWVEPQAADAVQRNRGLTRALANLLLLAPVAQVASFATSSSGMRDLFDQIREGGTFDTTTQPTTNGWLAVGQLVSMIGAAVLVLRMIWLFRAVGAARMLGLPVRRTPGWACAGWLIPIVNLWWPYQGMRDVTATADVGERTTTWWWLTYLVGSVGGAIGLMISWFVSAPVAVVALGVPAAFGLVSAVLERRLVLGAQAALSRRAGLDPAEF